MDTGDLKSRFLRFAGADRYRNFVRTINRNCRSKGRLLYWQQDLFYKIKKRSSEIAAEMQPGDELWKWTPVVGTVLQVVPCGVAIVRNGHIFKQWCVWKS